MTVDSMRVLLLPLDRKVSQADGREAAVTFAPAIAAVAEVDSFASHTTYRASRTSSSWYADLFDWRRAEGVNAVDIQRAISEYELVLIYAITTPASAATTPASSPSCAGVIAARCPATATARQQEQEQEGQ